MRHSILPIVALASLTPLASSQIYQTDFSTDAGWTFQALSSTCNSIASYTWAVDATPASHFAGPFHSAPASLNFNDGLSAGPAFGGTSCGSATSPPIDLSTAFGSASLSFWVSYDFNQASGCDLDRTRLQVSNDGFATLLLDECLATFGMLRETWHERTFKLDPAWGTVELRFTFFGGPGIGFNDPSGPFIDDLAVTADCVAPANYCVSAPNVDSASGAEIRVLGSPSVADNTLRLFTLGATRNTFAIAFYGDAQTQTASGNGFVCVGGNTFRLGVVSTGPNGVPSWPLDLTDPPQPAGMISPGSTWNFQWWFRDGPGAWNYSDGMSITFCE